MAEEWICNWCGKPTEEDDCPECGPEYRGPWVVCLTLLDQAYGGAEEGGWYYLTSEPELDANLRAFNDRDEAVAYVQSLRSYVDELNEGRPSISSVLSRGRYEYQVYEGWPKHEPETRPHYE